MYIRSERSASSVGCIEAFSCAISAYCWAMIRLASATRAAACSSLGDFLACAGLRPFPIGTDRQGKCIVGKCQSVPERRTARTAKVSTNREIPKIDPSRKPSAKVKRLRFHLTSARDRVCYTSRYKETCDFRTITCFCAPNLMAGFCRSI
jgi:hypothetical protein